MKDNFLKHFLIIGSGTIISMVIGLLTTPIITRIVDPVEYGYLSIFTMYSGIFLMVLCIGLDQALVRFFCTVDKNDYKTFILRKCAFLPLLLGIICSMLLMLLKCARVEVFGFSWIELILFDIYMFLQILNRFSVLVIRLEYHSKSYSLINICNKILYVALAIFLLKAFKVDGKFALLIATVVAYFLVTLLSIYFERNIWFNKVESDYRGIVDIKELIKYGAPFIISMGISTIFQYLDKISLNYFCGYEEVGIYTSASTLVAIFALVQSTFNTLWAPLSVEHYEHNPNDKSFFIKGNSCITVIMFVIGICLLAGKDIFVLLLGEKYRGAATVIPFLMFNPIMYTISETTVCGIVFMKKSKMQIVVAAGACITNFLGNCLLVPHFGCKGAAISTGISYIVFFLLRTLISNHYYYIDFGLKRFFVITAMLVGYAFYNTFFDNLLLSILFALIELAFLALMYKSTVQYLIGYVMRFIRRRKEDGI